MATFDPAAATAAYLAQLPPEAHAKAQAYTQGGHWLLLWAAVMAIVVAWIILKTGLLVRVRKGVERARPRPWLATAAVIAVAAVLEAVLGLPWNVYSQWWRETQYGLTSQPFAGWLSEWAMSYGISSVMSVILFSLVYWLIRRAPKTWWAWGGAVVTVFFAVMLTLGPVLIEPLFNDYKPAPPGPVRDAVEQMAEANGVPKDRIFIYDGSKQSNR
jgi:STE24 endopeptidase